MRSEQPSAPLRLMHRRHTQFAETEHHLLVRSPHVRHYYCHFMFPFFWSQTGEWCVPAFNWQRPAQCPPRRPLDAPGIDARSTTTNDGVGIHGAPPIVLSGTNGIKRPNSIQVPLSIFSSRPFLCASRLTPYLRSAVPHGTGWALDSQPRLLNDFSV
ncbi:hypothetical protein D3C75_814100 [compost metagenome]